MTRVITWLFLATTCIVLRFGLGDVPGGDGHSDEPSAEQAGSNNLSETTLITTKEESCIAAVSNKPEQTVSKSQKTSKAFFRGLRRKKKTVKWPFTRVSFTHPIQSPVDLITNKAKERDLPYLNIDEPDLPDVQAKFYNSGHTAYIYITGSKTDLRPYMEGGPLTERFIFEQMHFHWGSQNIWGSEHMVDGEAFSVEIHMVHFNSKYKNINKALDEDDGLAVLTIFAEVSESDNPLLNPLYERLPHVAKPDSYVYLAWEKAMEWALSALKTNKEYYTYPGSLTTPDYNENVVFIILPRPLTLSINQLSEFRKLHGKHGYITDNKRNLQPLHNRPIIKAKIKQKKSIFD